MILIVGQIEHCICGAPVAHKSKHAARRRRPDADIPSIRLQQHIACRLRRVAGALDGNIVVGRSAADERLPARAAKQERILRVVVVGETGHSRAMIQCPNVIRIPVNRPDKGGIGTVCYRADKAVGDCHFLRR